MFFRRDQWWKEYPELLRRLNLSDDVACVTADGRSFSRDHLEDLIEQGQDQWNKFKKDLPGIRWYRKQRKPSVWIPGFILKLPRANFKGKDLSFFDFTGCDLAGSNFYKAKLIGTHFSSGSRNAYEPSAELSGSDFRRSEIESISIGGCNLSNSNFYKCWLNGVHFRNCDLRHANFDHTVVVASFKNVDIRWANFESAYLLGAQFIDIDLSEAKNLSKCQFLDHALLDHRTLFKSGPLPDEFYRGCGLPEIFVEYMPSMTNTPIQMKSCFISYSSKDETFASKLYRDLQEQKVRCFFAPKNLKIGDIIRDALETAIHLNDKLLLILSENSISSQWVEHEVEAAFERERRENRLVLFPIMIDNSIMKSNKGWAANLRRQRHIGNFSDWNNHAEYYSSFRKLLSDITSE